MMKLHTVYIAVYNNTTVMTCIIYLIECKADQVNDIFFLIRFSQVFFLILN